MSIERVRNEVSTVNKELENARGKVETEKKEEAKLESEIARLKSELKAHSDKRRDLEDNVIRLDRQRLDKERALQTEQDKEENFKKAA